MKERPILFNAAMVRALLDGSKTQTRRVYKNRKHPDAGCDMAANELVREAQHVIDRSSPYGQPGDRLWVRETFGTKIRTIGGGAGEFTAYRATDPSDVYCETADGRVIPIKWKPSIHMPRWASRINLEITAVRVERLRDISRGDAIAEGIHGVDVVINGHSEGMRWRDYSVKCDDPCEWFGNAVDSYRSLWESINGESSWPLNPWVWVITFRRI